MAQISQEGQGTNHTASRHGMLYQYVCNGNQILEQASDNERSDEVDDAYTDLIKSSLDFLDKTAINPFILEFLDQNADALEGSNYTKANDDSEHPLM